MKKIKMITMLSIIMMVLSYIPVAASQDVPVQGQFKDVNKSHWAKKAIEEAVKAGYVAGYPDGTFKPEQQVSRAEFIRMLVDALKLPHIEKGSPWYQPYLAAALETYIHKTSDFKDGYNDVLTRAELVKLAVRSTDEQYRALGVAEDKNYMVYQATEDGILAGVGKGRLDLGGTTTRAQAVAIIERIISVNKGEKLSVDKYAVASAEILWHGTNIFTVMPQFFNKPVNHFPGSIMGINSWSMDKLKLENKDFSGELVELIAVNLGDKDDPNRGLLPSIDKLQWGYNTINPMPKDAYVLFGRYKINYNNNTKIYHNALAFDIRGFESKDTRFKKLSKPAGLFVDDPNFKYPDKTIISVFPGSGYSFNKDQSLTIYLTTTGSAGGPADSFMTSTIVSSSVASQ
ncbi:S-layer homology domain-containing protein [Cohnella panacarvi]|uniref:S-layer homology domain-containing protein n=1 Tax=Cohnella panacarvi TaxID=400776 RepID=UPI00047967EE|nr:S-layer homology domain-containing protein [Cohnella panacarvi]